MLRAFELNTGLHESEERVEQCSRVVARKKSSLVFLDPEEIWAFEAADRLAFVHCRQGRFDIDLSLAAIERSFGHALTRVHRNWLVNLDRVTELARDLGETALLIGGKVGSEGLRVPVSHDHAKAVRDLLLANATGLKPSSATRRRRRAARRPSRPLRDVSAGIARPAIAVAQR